MQYRDNFGLSLNHSLDFSHICEELQLSEILMSAWRQQIVSLCIAQKFEIKNKGSPKIRTQI